MEFTAADAACLWNRATSAAERGVVRAALRALPAVKARAERDLWLRLAAGRYPAEWADAAVAPEIRRRLIELREVPMEGAPLNDHTLDGALRMVLLLGAGFVPSARSIRRALAGLAN